MSRLSRHSRGRARRRLRYLRRLRDLQLRDAGGLVFDLYRFGEQREALVRGKLDAIIATDKEIRALEDLLGIAGRERVLEVRAPGVGGACPACGDLHASQARFCASCGAELSAVPPAPPARPAVPPAAASPTQPTAIFPAPAEAEAAAEEVPAATEAAAEVGPAETEAAAEEVPAAETSPEEGPAAETSPAEGPAREDPAQEVSAGDEVVAPGGEAADEESDVEEPGVDAEISAADARGSVEEPGEVAAVGPRRGSGQRRSRRRRGASE